MAGIIATPTQRCQLDQPRSARYTAASMTVSVFLLRWLLVPVVALWAVHMLQRRHAAVAGRKRYATLFLTALLIGVWIAAWFFVRYRVRDIFLVPVAGLAAALVAWKRAVFLPFRLRCARCGSRLPVTRILNDESNLCQTCGPAAGEPPGPRDKENTR